MGPMRNAQDLRCARFGPRGGREGHLRTRNGRKECQLEAQQESQQTSETGGEQEPQMCCDNSGRTAEEHRHEAADGKCCVD